MTLWQISRRVMAIALAIGVGASGARAQGSDAGGPNVPPPPPNQGTGTGEKPAPKTRPARPAGTSYQKRNHVELGLRFMAALPTGTAFDATDEDYSDLWGQGTAFGFHAAFMTTRIRPGSRSVVGSFGAYLAIDRYTFPAENHTFSASGNRMKADDFGMTTILFGARLNLPTTNIDKPVRFIGGIDIGLGFGLIDGIDTFYDQTPTGGFAADEPFYDDTVSFGFEISLRLGMAIRVAPTVEINPAFVVGYNLFIGPDNASSTASKRLKDADAGPMFNLFIGFSISTSLILPQRE